MIPKNTLISLKCCLIIASSTFCIPYQWDGKKGRLVNLQERWKLFLWRLSTLFHFLYGVFIVTSFIYQRSGQVAGQDSGDQQALMYHSLMMVNFVTSNFISLNYFLRRNESLLFLNSLLLFNENHQEPEEGNKAKDYFGLILLSLLPSTLFNNVIFGVLFLMFPMQPQYIYSYLNFEGRRELLTMLPFALNESFQAFHCAFTCFFFVYTSLVFERSVDNWLQYITSAEHRDYKYTIHIYRCLQFLQAKHNRAYRDVVTPVFFGAAMALLMFSCYGAVRFYYTIPMPGYLLLPVMFAIMCVFSVLLHHSSGTLYMSSKKFLRVSQQRAVMRGSDPEIRWILKSCYALRLYVGSAYFVRKDSIVTFVDGFTNNTLSLLLAF